MGIDYPCNHCGSMIYDHCDDDEIFAIEDWGDYIACGSCVGEVKEMLELKEPLKYYCIVTHKTNNKRNIFKSLTELKEWLGDKCEQEYNLGLFKSKEWSKLHQAAWMGEGSCGGMAMEQAKEVIDNGTVSKSVYIGWRDHEVVDKTSSFEAKTCNALHVYSGSWEHISKQINNYEKMNQLEGVPFLVTTWNSSHALLYFCFPDRDSRIEFFPSLKLLEKTLVSPSGVYRVRDIVWVIGPAFIEYHRDRAEEKIDQMRDILDQEHHRAEEKIKKFKRRIKALDKLKEAVKKFKTV